MIVRLARLFYSDELAQDFKALGYTVECLGTPREYLISYPNKKGFLNWIKRSFFDSQWLGQILYDKKEKTYYWVMGETGDEYPEGFQELFLVIKTINRYAEKYQ